MGTVSGRARRKAGKELMRAVSVVKVGSGPT